MLTEVTAGTRVRLLGDPTRIGFLSGEQRARRGRALIQVKFPDMTSWVPADQLEAMPLERESPLDLLSAGKLGRAVDLRRALAHVRLTGRLADVIYSMETTNTDFYSYQFKPVLRFLNSPSNALLIADEVGLGKTIEAGLIWTELRSRFELRRILVLCPAMLRKKWRRELLHKIGVDADIVDAQELLKRLQDLHYRTRGFALICSLEGARPHRGWRQNDEDRSGPAELARFLLGQENIEPVTDLLIIDEAHYLRNPESQTNELGQLLRPVTEHLVLLTATPIHNYNQDLFTLLQLLDGDTFQRESDLALILEASRPLVRARDIVLSKNYSQPDLSTALDEAESHPLLRGSRQLALIREHITGDDWLTDRDRRAELASRLEMINPLAYVITRTRKRDVKEWRVVRDPVAESVPMAACEEDFYQKVTEYVISYAMTRAVNERFILATPQREMSSSMPASLRAWLHKRENIDDTAAASRANSAQRAEMGPLTRELCIRVPDFGDLEQLVRNDTKYARVQKILREFFRKHPQEKVVLFSTFRETLAYLSERLSEDGIHNIVMHGGVSRSKDDILSAFENDASIRVLLSSEVGSEGIDLQFCRVLVNYDLPWNPMRVEQRIGRLDRLGQTADRILIWNLFYAGTIDDRIYHRLYEKLDVCRLALGDFEAVLGDEIRKLTTDLLSRHLTPGQQEARIDQTAQALANLKRDQEQLEGEASSLVAYGDYILNQIQAARDLNRWITGEDLRAYVTDFFSTHYPGCSFRQLAEDSPNYEIGLSPEAAQRLDDYVRRARIASDTRLTRGGARAVRCRFENRTTIGRAAHAELISQFHPLVRFVSDEITEREEQLTPAVAVQLRRSDVPDAAPASGRYALAGVRWSVQGLQAVEKLVFAAVRLDGKTRTLSRMQAEQLANHCARHGRDWFEAPREVDLRAIAELADDALFGQLDEEYEEFVDDIRRRNEDRADLQLRNLQRHLDRQRRKLNEIRDRHLALGRESLAKATQGRLDALEGRVERQRLRIEGSREVTHKRDEVIVAVVQVHD